MKKVYIIATVMALVTGLAVYFFICGLQKSVSKAQAPTMSVVVAKTNIGINTVLTEDMLTVKVLPSDSITPGTASDVNSLVGKIVKYPITAGEQIVVSRLETPGSSEGNDLSYQLKENERAVTISVDSVTGIAGFIRAGDRVDIMITETVRGVVKTYYLLQNVRVLKISDKAANAAGAEINTYSTVTLCLSPEDSLKLGDAVGRDVIIRLILRPVAATVQSTQVTQMKSA